MFYVKNLINRLENIILSSDARSKYSGSNFEREVKQALNDGIAFCVKCHLNQRRDDGEPYYLHPIRVAAYAEVYIAGVDEHLVRNIALLHDVMEDCDVSYEDIESRFGKFVADHVLELTNVYTKAKYPHLSRKERKKLEHDRLASCSNLTRQIKLIDRLDNINTGKISSNLNYLGESEDLLNKLGNSNPELKQLLSNKIRRFKGATVS